MIDDTTEATASPRSRAGALFAIGFAVVVAVGLPACGGSDEGGNASRPEQTTTTGAAGTDQTTTSAGEPGDTEPDEATDVLAAVSIMDFAFEPERLETPVGTTVTFTNDDATGHTVTSTGAGGFDSGTLGAGDTFEVPFDEAGTFEYFCEIHPTMTGTLVIS